MISWLGRKAPQANSPGSHETPVRAMCSQSPPLSLQAPLGSASRSPGGWGPRGGEAGSPESHRLGPVWSSAEHPCLSLENGPSWTPVSRKLDAAWPLRTGRVSNRGLGLQLPCLL